METLQSKKSGKDSYDNCPRKRKTRKDFLSNQKYKTLFTLLGPNAEDSCKEAISLGYKRIKSWEFNIDTFINQKSLNLNAELNFGSIQDAPIIDNAIYDIDLCQTLFTSTDIVKKFKNTNAIFTFALRNPFGYGKEEFFNIFLQCMDDILIVSKRNGNEYIIIGANNIYKAVVYRDTDQMIMIKKF